MRKVSREICNHAKEVPYKSKDRCIYIYNEKINEDFFISLIMKPCNFESSLAVKFMYLSRTRFLL